MNSRWKLFRSSLYIAVAALFIGIAGAQQQWPAQTPGPAPNAPAQAPPQQMISPQQIDDLVAPIALYPDPLLSQVLVASTYPVEVVEAQQWMQRNPNLSGAALVDAAKQQNWDPSVQALVAFPDVLAKLNQDIRWTTDLGNAFLAQQNDVMAAVQQMRAQARNNGKLYSTPQQTVTTEAQNGQAAIEILPANPQVVYVPNYDPAYIWGPPAWGYYPPLYYPAYGFGFGPGLNIGLCFGGWGGVGFGFGLGWGGWGWGPNWFGHGVYVNNAFFSHYGFRGGYGYGGRAAWAFNPAHRMGVAYPNRALASRYGGASRAYSARAFSGQGRMNSYGQAAGGNRGFSGGQGSRGSAAQGAAARGFQNGASYRGAAQGYAGSRYASPVQRSTGFAARSYSGGAARSYSGGGAVRSYSGGGGAARSYSGGGGHSFGGGGGGHSFGGGGHSGGGGGHSGGGGGHSGRR